jgi:hypothetical protein
MTQQRWKKKRPDQPKPVTQTPDLFAGDAGGTTRFTRCPQYRLSIDLATCIVQQTHTPDKCRGCIRFRKEKI